MEVKKLLTPVAALVCAGVLLAAVSLGLDGVAAKNLAENQQQVMEQLLPGSHSFEPETYDGEDANITALFKGETGYVVETTVSGYAGDMVLWVGVDNDGAVTGITVRDMAETWGLGRRAMSDRDFLAQFLGTTGEAAVNEDVDALSGATVTSKAVTRAVNSAAAFVSGADVSSSATEWGG